MFAAISERITKVLEENQTIKSKDRDVYQYGVQQSRATGVSKTGIADWWNRSSSCDDLLCVRLAAIGGMLDYDHNGNDAFAR